jgi:hypothetical protein
MADNTEVNGADAPPGDVVEKTAPLIAAALTGNPLPTSPKPAPNPTKDSADAAPVNESKAAADQELAALREKVATFEKAEKSTAERREAEDVTNDFIRKQDFFPAQMLRTFLPVTKDPKVLNAELTKLGQWYRQMLDADIKKGRVQYLGIGGSPGGEAITGEAFRPKTNPSHVGERIAQSLPNLGHIQTPSR